MGAKASGLWAWSGLLQMKGGPSLGQVVRLASDTVTDWAGGQHRGHQLPVHSLCHTDLAPTHPLNIKHPF